MFYRFIIFVIATSFFLVGCAKQAVQDKVETVAIKVESIQCNMCVKTIEGALTSVDGVTSAEVDLKAKTATVQFLPAKVNLGSLEQAIAKAGYDANETKRDVEAYEKFDACCKIDG